MNAITFDTLKYAEDLVASGMPEAQAKALAKAQAELFERQAEGLASKADLYQAIAPVKADLLLVKWMLALVIVVTVVPILKTFFT
jgi:hypothetical protein